MDHIHRNLVCSDVAHLPLFFRCSMEGGELFDRIKERGDRAFTERGFLLFLIFF